MRAYLSPRLVAAHLLAVVAVGVAATLGLWQYDAWQARRTAEAVDLTGAQPLPLPEVIGPDDPFPGDRVGQPVTVSGTWEPAATVLVSGRPRGGEEGYWVVTPLLVDTEQAALPVVRGWVATADAAPTPPEGTAELVAWLQPPEGTGAVDPDPTDEVYPQLRVADLAQRLDSDVYSAYAVAQDGVGGLPPGDLAELPEAGRFTALRNLLYAVEWWVFGAFAGFVWWRFVRESLEESAAADPVASGP